MSPLHAAARRSKSSCNPWPGHPRPAPTTSANPARAGRVGPRARHRLVFFFDLDDTLHDASHAIFGVLNRRMTEYVQRHLQVGEAEANRLRQTYWHRYGATLLGLTRHHAVDPHHFLRETHDFDIPSLLRAERGLTKLFRRLPGRKVLLTNAPAAYAHAVVRELELHRHLPQRYTIESMRVHGQFRPKPSLLMLRTMLARERCGAGRAVLIEDSRVNLKAARALGFKTVLVSPVQPRRGRSPGRPAYVDQRIRSVRELPRVLARLRRG
jgi:putative hydrolase of the HAD superfamily